MYMTYHILSVLSAKHLVNQDGEKTRPHKLATGSKPSVSNILVLFCLCVVQKALHMLTQRRQVCVINYKMVFPCYFIDILQHQIGYIIYVHSTRNYFLHIPLYLKKHFIVGLHTRQISIQMQLLCSHQSRKFRTLHRLMIKLTIL